MAVGPSSSWDVSNSGTVQFSSVDAGESYAMFGGWVYNNLYIHYVASKCTIKKYCFWLLTTQLETWVAFMKVEALIIIFHFRKGIEVNLWDITSCSKIWSAKSVSTHWLTPFILFLGLLALLSDVIADCHALTTSFFFLPEASRQQSSDIHCTLVHCWNFFVQGWPS